MPGRIIDLEELNTVYEILHPIWWYLALFPVAHSICSVLKLYIFSKYLFNYNSSVYVCLYMCVFDNIDFRRM